MTEPLRTETQRLLLWVQHLLGIGHVRRAAALARAFCQAGWQVDFVSGGFPVQNIDIGSAKFYQLPPLKAADATFSGLVTPENNPVDDAYLNLRETKLLQMIRDSVYQAAIFEHFPFGRRALRGEVSALLTTLKKQSSPPIILSSVRDILVQRREKRSLEAADTIDHEFDGVLVHGSEGLIPLECSFPFVERLRNKIFYTGYIDSNSYSSNSDISEKTELIPTIIVSTGGGAVGERLIATAIAASRQDPSRLWRVLAGHNLPDAIFLELKTHAPDNCIVERARSDFRTLLEHSAATISQAGYNTVVDILMTNAKAVLVPFATENETEQALRANKLAEAGRVVSLMEDDLTPARLLKAVEDAVTRPIPDMNIQLGGAETSVKLIEKLCATQQTRLH